MDLYDEDVEACDCGCQAPIKAMVEELSFHPPICVATELFVGGLSVLIQHLGMEQAQRVAMESMTFMLNNMQDVADELVPEGATIN
jgi:hypothetical protein